MSDFSALADPLWVALGAVPGALSRYYFTQWCTHRFGSTFPYGTFAVNLFGAFLMGFFTTLLQAKFAAAQLNLLITVGFLGAYTTFSTYALDTFQLFRTNCPRLAWLYWLGSPLAGLVCLGCGIFLALCTLLFWDIACLTPVQYGQGA